MNLEGFKETFKILLVRRYQWTVTKASEYNSPALDTAFKDGLSVQDAYYRIFNVEQDLQILL